MSNFLSNLALRSLRPATAPALLQPRLPSLFESPGGLDHLPVPPMEAEAEKQASPREAAAELGLPTRTEKPKGAALSVEPQRTILHHLDQAITLNDRHTAKEVMPQVERPSTGRSQAQPVSANELPARPGLRSAQQDQEPSVENKSGDRRLHPPIELVPAPRDSKPAPATSAPATSATLRPRSAEPELKKPTEQTPVVQIHIGRIEVRAVTSAPVSSPPPTSRPPRLTLDDYLRQRNEGKR